MAELVVFASVVAMVVIVAGNMVVSLDRGTPILTPLYYIPYYGDPQKGTLVLGNPKP